MCFTVGISPQAGQDLEDIVFFITAREQDAQPAERFASVLVDEARKLADFPHRGKVFQRRPNVRRLVHGNYLHPDRWYCVIGQLGSGCSDLQLQGPTAIGRPLRSLAHRAFGLAPARFAQWLGSPQAPTAGLTSKTRWHPPG
jgi:plasmid stabilization system protein ParE